MENIIAIIILIIIVPVCILIIWRMKNRFISSTYPAHTSQMLEDIRGLEEIGLLKNEKGYKGIYRDFHINIYATTTFRANDRFQVLLATAPKPGQLKMLKGLTSLYFVIGETDGFAYAGFYINPKIYNDHESSLKGRIDKLINILNENNVMPYQVSS